MSKILYLSYYFPPWANSGVKRGPRFVKYLRRRGHKVTVVTKEVGAEGAISLPSPEPCSSGEAVKRKGKFLFKFFKLILFPDTKILWFILNYPRLKDLIKEREMDLLISSAPPFSSLLCARLLSLTTGKPYIVDLRDPWTETPLLYESSLLKWLHRLGEKRSLNRARVVITINERITQDLRKRYKWLKVETVTHGFDPNDFQGLKYKKREMFRITYVGTLTERRTPKFILEALSGIEGINWELLLVGEKWIDMRKLVARYGLGERVRLIPRVSFPEALEYMVSSDILWLMVGRGRGARFVSTSKLFDYLGSGRPILATIPDSAARDILEGIRGVRITEPEDIEGIRRALRDFHHLWKEDKLPSLQAHEIAPYRMENVVQKLTNHLME